MVDLIERTYNAREAAPSQDEERDEAVPELDKGTR
jgi:hypothetical protein